MEETSQSAPARVVKATRRWIGTPYHDQASVCGVGCDCLGLLRGVWRDVVGPEPMPVPPYSRDWGETGPVEVLAEAARAAMQELEVPDARTGDVVLFRMRAGAIAKHVGILSGGDTADRGHRTLGHRTGLGSVGRGHHRAGPEYYSGCRIHHRLGIQAKAAEEVLALPEGSAVVDMLSDYAVMRDQARVCNG